ncbi:glycosyl hydrolase [Maribellus mangrovi]|uniref:glycosyl hydrolase n=1 Tax=Maribellus mangrovi TaxID=3133146 RepID=UPI0030EEE993
MAQQKRTFKYSRSFSKYLLLAGLFLSRTLLASAIEKEMVDNLVNEDRVLSSAIELHIISAESPLVNSTVNLEHEDAWLFFDNIRPSEVIATYTSSVKINGAVLKVGSNGRVAIYGQGTVIMPFPGSFKPLTVYTEENFDGNSTQLSIQTYHNNLGDFDNVIKSFKLKRGYMATFANNADGSGYSRVFIADEADLLFEEMPGELFGSVSFIRVFKYEWVSKKGKAGWNPNDINSPTYYDWNIGGSSSSDVEYVAIRQNGGWPSWSAINEKQNITHLLGFNEPDRPDQADMNFQAMIDQWPEMMKSGLRIGSPAWSNPWGGNGGNLFDFINKCDELNYRVDFVALHCYWGGKSPQNWYNDLKYIHEQTGRPLWITEWNNGANWTNEWWPDDSKAYTPANAQKQLNDMKGILQVLDTASFIERYFIYDWVQDCRAMVLNGELTLAGEYYAQNKSEIAYNNKKEVIPHWNYKSPELSYRYFSFRNSIRVSWTNPNGELSRQYILQRKIDEGAFETTFTTEDPSEDFYLDPLDPEIYGTISYRVMLQTADGNFKTSNIESYYQTAGEDEIQVGNFSVDNSDINTAVFPVKYSSTPIVLLGIPTMNNNVAMTQRIGSISTTQFLFNFFPWSYIENSGLRRPEVLSALALPAGAHDLNGLQADAGSVSGVTREWVSVTFDEAFSEAPVVFCTVGTRVNFYPLTVAVRNVTSTGFEISLKSEETNTASLTGEIVNYLAVEPGTGGIDGKRITVGKNYGGQLISTIPIEIVYDSSYSEPAVFAGLLSSEDNFASTLRYSLTGDSGIELKKQRELSGGESEMKADDFGWMVMDLATDQPDIGTSIGEIGTESPIKFYPNPAKDEVYFNFISPTYIEIFDMTGRKMLGSNVVYSLNIRSLPKGIYLMKADGKYFGKLISVD